MKYYYFDGEGGGWVKAADGHEALAIVAKAIARYQQIPFDQALIAVGQIGPALCKPVKSACCDPVFTQIFWEA